MPDESDTVFTPQRPDPLREVRRDLGETVILLALFAALIAYGLAMYVLAA